MSEASAPRLMALDVGERRIGIALTDPLGLLAHPLFTLPRSTSPRKDSKWISRLVQKHAVAELVVGLPLLLDGQKSEQTSRVQAFVELLREFLTIPIHLHDERLSTWQAEQHMESVRPRGRSLEARHARQSMVDQVAAVLILEGFLEHRNHLRARAALTSTEPSA